MVEKEVMLLENGEAMAKLARGHRGVLDELGKSQSAFGE